MRAKSFQRFLVAAVPALLLAPAIAAPSAPPPAPEKTPRISQPPAVRAPQPPKTTVPKTSTPQAARLPKVPPVQYTEHTLANGLRVFLVPDASAPVVSVAIVYNVGSFVETAGHTGFAHLFEHMMFQGSKNVAKAEHAALITEAGGTMNGGTTQDYTVYYEELPANQLPLALFLEGDRMGSLDVSQQNLDNQRQVVEEERRMRYDNQPYGTLYEKLLNLAYTQSPYKHPPIGSMADINKASLADVRQFFHTYYAPDNAVLAIVGDFQPRRAMDLVQKYFGDIPRGPQPQFPSLYEPPQTEERRLVYTDPLAPLPDLVAAWHIPAGTDPDAPALEVLGDILGGDKSSRLWQSLVEKQQLAADVSASGAAGRGPDLFTIDISFAPGQKVEPAEKAAYAEIARIQKDGVTPAEIQKVRTQAVRDAIAGRRSSMHRAQEIAVDAVVYNDPDRINTWTNKILAVTAADVQRVAQKYLIPTNRTVVIAMPPEKGAAPAKPQAPASPAAQEAGQ